MSRALLIAILAVAACSRPNHSLALGASCGTDADCQSSHCIGTECVSCGSNADCAPGQVCAAYGRIAGPYGGPRCQDADGGCASTPAQCPGGFSCYSCPGGRACDDATGECTDAGVSDAGSGDGGDGG